MSGIAKAIKHWRNKRNLTQKELGKMINIDENAISHFENDRRVPTIELIMKMADALKIKPEKLITPQKEVLLPDMEEMVIGEYSFLEQHEYFRSRTHSSNGLFIVYKFEFDGEVFKLGIHKKLLSLTRSDDIQEDSRIKYESVYELPNWFQNLMQISFEKIFQLQEIYHIEMNIYHVIIYSLLKNKSLFSSNLSVAREHGSILLELRENQRIISKKEEITKTIFEISNKFSNVKLIEKQYYEVKYEG